MPEPALSEWGRAAEAWAVQAGAIALDHLGRAAVRNKSDGSEVTDADLAIQTMLVASITDALPGHAVIGEESLEQTSVAPAPADARYCWVLDPLDGTRNYARGYPAFATSIALLDRGTPVVGVVRWHHTRQTFTGVRGGGATVNGIPIRASAAPVDQNMLVGAQLGPSHRTHDVVGPWLKKWPVRNLGATSLHLALVAAGSLGAAYAKDCWIWDLAAGAVLIHEAGGRCTGLEGRPIFPVELSNCATTNYPFIAGGKAGHRALLDDLTDRRDEW